MRLPRFLLASVLFGAIALPPAPMPAQQDCEGYVFTWCYTNGCVLGITPGTYQWSVFYGCSQCNCFDCYGNYANTCFEQVFTDCYPYGNWVAGCCPIGCF
jgi:hypothetical protein